MTPVADHIVSQYNWAKTISIIDTSNFLMLKPAAKL